MYCAAIRNGGIKEWEFASAQYDKETNANQKSYLQSGMSCTKIPWLTARFLNDQINSTKVRSQDTISGLNAAAVKPYANARTWTFIKENWSFLFEK